MISSNNPLHGQAAQRELFRRFTEQANGFSTTDVIGAACNIIINALRLTYMSRREVEVAFDEWFSRAKQALISRYTALGAVKGDFSFEQALQYMRKDSK